MPQHDAHFSQASRDVYRLLAAFVDCKAVPLPRAAFSAVDLCAVLDSVRPALP